METLVLKEEEMVKNGLYYITVVQGKIPARKSDIIKIAMNKQSKDFQKVIVKIGKSLRRTFGLRLIGMKNGPNDHPIMCKLLEATSYITINVFRQHIIAMTTPDQTFSADLVKAALLLILTCSYMMDKTLDEETIWGILEGMDIDSQLLKRKEDLKRFLKSEYVDPLYLAKEEEKDQEKVVLRYGWGIRANMEFSKYAILKFVTQSMGKRPEDFVNHFAKISQDEIKEIDEEDEIMKKGSRARENEGVNNSVDEGRDTSQLTIPQSAVAAAPIKARRRSSRNSSHKEVNENSDSDSD